MWNGDISDIVEFSDFSDLLENFLEGATACHWYSGFLLSC